MSQEFKVPDLGENMEGGDVVAVLVAPGDEIQPEQNVLELETDKATVELPCPFGGKVVTVHVSEGDSIKIGDLVLTLEELAGSSGSADSGGGGAAASPDSNGTSDATESATAVETAAPTATAVAERATNPEPRVESAPVARAAPVVPVAPIGEPSSNGDGRAPAPAGPATRRLARELGVDLHQVPGSGPSGRISRDDVKEFVRRLSESVRSGGGAGAPVELPDFIQWGEVEYEPLKGIRKATSEAMSVAWRTIPHVTQFDHADITELEAARKRYQSSRQAADEGRGKITMTVLALKAVVAALQKFPQFNSSIDVGAGQIIRKKYFHIGIAVDTPGGLLVPVIRDVDTKSLAELALELGDIAQRARDRKIGIDEMRGGTFTITNLGGIGGTAFTPIVNHPEVAILGIARGKNELVLENGEVTSRLQLPLCLSYDHRVIDGADGARFLRYISDLLSDPFLLMLGL